MRSLGKNVSNLTIPVVDRNIALINKAHVIVLDLKQKLEVSARYSVDRNTFAIAQKLQQLLNEL